MSVHMSMRRQWHAEMSTSSGTVRLESMSFERKRLNVNGNLCIDIRIDMRIDVCIDACIDMCIDASMVMCTGMGIWVWMHPSVCATKCVQARV